MEAAMADAKPDTKVTKVDMKAVGEPAGIITSWLSHSTELAERTTLTVFGIARDIRGEINARILGALSLIEGTQAGALKLVKTIDERLDKLAEDAIDTAESLTLNLIRTVRDTSHGVTSVVAKAA
jgi:hypothetical protein